MYSAVDDISKFNDLAGRLERAEATRRKTGLMQARKNLAPRLGITASTLENYRTLRLKGVPHWLMQKARDELVKLLQLEMDRLGNEIQFYKRAAESDSGDTLAEAEASLAKVRQMLSVGMKPETHIGFDPPQ